MDNIIKISGKNFFISSLAVASIILILGKYIAFSPTFILIEILITVVLLFVFGSIRYRLDKNVITYSMVFVILATFFNCSWDGSPLQLACQEHGFKAILDFVTFLLSFSTLNKFVHLDTMLFILGLTFFVSAISTTRLLETVSFYILKKNKGRIYSTMILITLVVSIASGILDGVSMIGLMIRIVIIIFALIGLKGKDLIFGVLLSTITTTICGIWLAYGEPPNLIMKSNLYPALDNIFFLRYCLPIAFASFFVLCFFLRKSLKGKILQFDSMDLLDRYTDDIRFLQSEQYGHYSTQEEVIRLYKDSLGQRLHDTLITELSETTAKLPMVLLNNKVSSGQRMQILSRYSSPIIAPDIDSYYRAIFKPKQNRSTENLLAERVGKQLQSTAVARKKAQLFSKLSFLPFVAFLVVHSINKNIPLFVSSFLGYSVVLIGIFKHKELRKFSFHESIHEYKEYLFLFPLFLSITLLQYTGFFNIVEDLTKNYIEKMGIMFFAYIKFISIGLLSALLDNNIVADFASRSMKNFDLEILHILSMVQIAGYAVGGCLTHIGSAQSIVAYAFIRKSLDKHFTPLQWIRMIVPMLAIIALVVFVIITITVFICL